jgi:methionyl-tRNA formyltransferase
MRIGYFADGPWAHDALKRIAQNENWQVVFICVRNDAPDGFLIDYASQNGIDCLNSPNVNSIGFLETAKKYKADIFVSMSFNQILRSALINMPKYKTINCHAGKLPYYRGRNILNWVLINDEKEFGVTVHFVDEGIDTGDIILQDTYEITDADDYQTLLGRAYEACGALLYQALEQIDQGSFSTIAQKSIDPVGFYCGMREEGDEVIDWRQTSRQIFNFVRAVAFPGPKARSYIGDHEMKINKAEMINGAIDYIGIAGQVVGKGNDGIVVKTGDNTIRIVEYEYDGAIRIGDRLK